jgi:hypothetical protein
MMGRTKMFDGGECGAEGVRRMTDVSLTQDEAEALRVMEKHRVDDRRHSFPLGGESLAVPLQSADRQEQFFLDINRRGRRIDLRKVTYQNRARQSVVLVRLDLGGPPHRNPDGVDIPCPHLHEYREGFGDKWAFPVPRDRFSRTGDLRGALEDFMQFCNITQPPCIEEGDLV